MFVINVHKNFMTLERFPLFHSLNMEIVKFGRIVYDTIQAASFLRKKCDFSAFVRLNQIKPYRQQTEL